MNATVTRLKDDVRRGSGAPESAFAAKPTDAPDQAGQPQLLHGPAARSDVGRRRESGGSVFIARLAHLATVNQSLGREATDELLRRFGKVLDLKPVPGSARRPSPHASTAPTSPCCCRSPTPRATAEAIAAALTQGGSELPARRRDNVARLRPLPAWHRPGTVLAQVDAALAAVEAEGRNGLRIVDLGMKATMRRRAPDEWSRLIRRPRAALGEGSSPFPVVALPWRA